PMTASARHAVRSAAIWIFTIGAAHTPALTGKHRMRPTSIVYRKVPPHELRRAFGVLLRSGYALPASHPKSASHQPRKPGRTPLIFRAELFRQTEPPQPHIAKTTDVYIIIVAYTYGMYQS